MFRAIAIAVMAVFILCGPGLSADLTENDRNAGLAHLQKTRDGVVEAVRGLSADQWQFKQAPDRWSVAEVVEHLAVTEGFLFDMVVNRVMNAPAGDPQRNVAEGDKLVLAAIPDRSQRATAPAEVAPAARWKPEEALEQLQKARARTEGFLKGAQGLRDHVMDSPIGPLDAYQWVLFISAHTERHLKQILEVKADSRFPGK